MSLLSSPFRKSPARQRGMATILIVLLAGLALTATALGVMHAVRGAQHKQVAVHASTNAQAGAWAGTEIFRQYLEQLDESVLGQLKTGDDIVMKVGGRELHASIAAVQQPAEGASEKRYQVTANIRNQDDAARATSTIQAVYSVLAGGSGDQPAPGEPWDNVINISGNLDMRGSIKVEGGDAAHFNVDGNVNLNSAAITGIKTIRATGDIDIGSAIQIEELFSNGNITLGGASSVLKASTLGNVIINSAGSQGVINANGDIAINNGSVATANALGNITASSGGSHGTLTAGKTLSISNGTTATANAVGNLTLGNWPTVRQLNSQANVTCPGASWNNFDHLRAGGKAINCPTGGKVSAPTSVSIALMSPLQPFAPPKPHVDAYELKESANYLFQYVDGKIQVSVRNINGIADGSYRIGKILQPTGEKWGYLCSALDGNGMCRDECSSVVNGSCAGPGVEKLHKITQGTWDGDQSIAYSNGKWTLRAKNRGEEPAVVAPGVLWFEGNVELGNGRFRNSILATGNIETTGSHATWAVNYVGYAETCTSAYYAGLYPTNFCDTATRTLKSNSLGNVGLLAGGYVGSTFGGGNIDLGASTEIYGSVVAGNLLQTGGNTLINGYITSANQTHTSTTNWGGSTTIDLKNLPPTYDPGSIPDMGDETPCQNNCGEQEGEQATTATLQWSRYL